MSRRAADAGRSTALSPAFRHAQLSFRAYGLAGGATTTTPRSRARLHGEACMAGFHRRLPSLTGGRLAVTGRWWLAVNGAGRTLEACRAPAWPGPATGRRAPGYGPPGSRLRVLDLLDDSAAELPLDEFHAAQAVSRPRSGGVVWPLLVGDGSWLGRRRVTGPRRLGLACPGRPGPGSPGCGGCGARWLRCPSSFGGPASGGAVRCSWA